MLLYKGSLVLIRLVTTPQKGMTATPLILSSSSSSCFTNNTTLSMDHSVYVPQSIFMLYSLLSFVVKYYTDPVTEEYWDSYLSRTED